MEDKTTEPPLELLIDTDAEGTTVKPMQRPRSRLLLSCGRSMVAMAQKTYQRVERMNCPVGCLARGVSYVAAPVLKPLQLRCFSALSFVDRQILAVQDVSTAVFPPSARLFRKVDELAVFVESLPVKLDSTIDGLGAALAWFVPERYHGGDGGDEGAVKDIRCHEDSMAEGLLQWSPARELRLFEGLEQESIGEGRHCNPGEGAELAKAMVHDDDDENGTLQERAERYDDDGSGTGDPMRTMDVGSPEKETNVEAMHCRIELEDRGSTYSSKSNEGTEDYAEQDAPQMAVDPEMEEQGSSSEVTVTVTVDSMKSTLEVETLGEAGSEERAEGFKQDGDAKEDDREAQGRSERIMETSASTKDDEVERHWSASQEGESSKREGAEESKELLELIDEVWQLKLI